MVKKMPLTPRAARRTVTTDVVTRVSAHDISHRAHDDALSRDGGEVGG